MAFFDSDQSLNIVIKARDEASKVIRGMEKNIKGFQGKIKAMAPTFKKMSVAGGIAFAGISVAAKEAIQQAAKAEGSYNKFNTVFGEGADDMLDFIKEIRKEMPTATSEIVRMSADLQDLLVPMGLTREKGAEMTKGFVDLANKVAAFNDVDPTEVLEAIKSGLSGSSEPLRRFGINALETALEARALKEGLLEVGQSFKDLDPAVKTQVRAQALLAQAIDNSSDAINGFEANNDSFIRRQQDLNATITEFKEALGTSLLPIVDELLKKLLPVVETVKEWVTANPELTKAIFIGVAAFAALVTVVGLLGLALPAIITGFTLLLGPIGLVFVAIGLLIAIGVALIKNWDKMKIFASESWQSIKDIVGGAVDWIKNKVQSAIDLWNKMTKIVSTPIRAAGGFISGAFSSAKGALGFEHGGRVPGPKGQAIPIIAHGQEQIIPANQARGGGSNFNIVINNPQFRNEEDEARMRRMLDTYFRPLLTNHKISA